MSPPALLPGPSDAVDKDRLDQAAARVIRRGRRNRAWGFRPDHVSPTPKEAHDRAPGTPRPQLTDLSDGPEPGILPPALLPDASDTAGMRRLDPGGGQVRGGRGVGSASSGRQVADLGFEGKRDRGLETSGRPSRPHRLRLGAGIPGHAASAPWAINCSFELGIPPRHPSRAGPIAVGHRGRIRPGPRSRTRGWEARSWRARQGGPTYGADPASIRTGSGRRPGKPAARACAGAFPAGRLPGQRGSQPPEGPVRATRRRCGRGGVRSGRAWRSRGCPGGP
ncbi:hypothetical protein EDD29_3859 [Actinocorallia herbida]|uniref:Uncharacterized protein n=1 Tax=Actinocorallia herbida TaxID=58109 RepID=A0A3N1CYI1_9ACTN|nr:hypothetical protein EDD29_3859 [Actinocorallia herbida]